MLQGVGKAAGGATYEGPLLESMIHYWFCCAFLRYNIFFVIYDDYGYSEISGVLLKHCNKG